MKLCKDCKHCEATLPDMDTVCLRTVAFLRDDVDEMLTGAAGMRVSRACLQERRDSCGRGAKFFEARK